MAKTVYIKRKKNGGYPEDYHYLEKIENQSELEKFISKAITDDEDYGFDGGRPEGQDLMYDSDYVVLLYDNKHSGFIEFSLYKLEVKYIFHKKASGREVPVVDGKPLLDKNISYRHVAEVDGEPLSSLFSGHQDKIEF